MRCRGKCPGIETKGNKLKKEGSSSGTSKVVSLHPLELVEGLVSKKPCPKNPLLHRHVCSLSLITMNNSKRAQGHWLSYPTTGPWAWARDTQTFIIIILGKGTV